MARRYSRSWTTVGIISVVLGGTAWVTGLVALAFALTMILFCLAVPAMLMAWLLAVAGLICGIVAQQRNDRYAWVGITVAVVFIAGNILLGLLGVLGAALEPATGNGYESVAAPGSEEFPVVNALALSHLLAYERGVHHGDDMDGEHDRPEQKADAEVGQHPGESPPHDVNRENHCALDSLFVVDLAETREDERQQCCDPCEML